MARINSLFKPKATGDEVVFQDDSVADLPTAQIGAPWRVLIVDDDPSVHEVTRLVLGSMRFEGRAIELTSAFSGREGSEVLRGSPDFALAVIDVVMETDHAGLDLVREIRDVLKLDALRILLRTGQPGQAPENDVIERYEINDYKDKTELTATKLRTAVFAALRGYRDLCTIARQRAGLIRVLDNTTLILKSSSLDSFASAVLEQVVNLIDGAQSALYCITQPTDQGESRLHHTLAATGALIDLSNTSSLTDLPPTVGGAIEKALSAQSSVYVKEAYVLYQRSEAGYESVLYFQIGRGLDEIERQLLTLYCTNVALTYQNLLVNEDTVETQREMAYLLGEAVEHRSRETGAHVRRVALYVERLGELYGLGERECTLLKRAAPLHDLGKIATPDHILHKPGPLDADEWVIMQQHAQVGAEILGRSNRAILQKAAELAGSHHEKWDGSGYPKGLAGEAIPLSGRLVALADVFDALATKRSYKPAWPRQKVREALVEQSGKHFEPRLIELLLAHEDEFYAIQDSLLD
jgi:response regulator RpfG family c-di-GMP phosphodiesterase